jgi:hypothetical protein
MWRSCKLITFIEAIRKLSFRAANK